MKNKMKMWQIATLSAFVIYGCSKAQTESTPQITSPASKEADSNVSASVLIDNNTVWRDTNNAEIMAQGGNMFEDGTLYHWFGMNYIPSTNVNCQGSTKWASVSHYTSTDLKSWTKQAAAFAPGASGIPFGACDWVGRPFVMKNPNNNNYVMAIEWAYGSSTTIRNRYCFLTATSVNGPWTYQSSKMITNLPNKTGTPQKLGDLGVFVDGSTAYLAYTFDYPEANYSRGILKLASDFMTPLASTSANYEEFTGESGVSWQINEVREAAAIFKRGSIYYYFTSKCAGWPSSDTRYRTSTTVTSATNDWSAPALVLTNPSSSNSYNTQHDFVIPVVGTTTTTYMYCGDRWNNMNSTVGGVGKYQWFPMTFDNSTVPVPTMHAPNFSTNGGDWTIDAVTGVWASPSSNVLTNPGFENNFTNWTTAGNASIATAAAEIRSGTKALKSYSTSAYTTTVQSVASTSYPAGTYNARVWGRCGGGTVTSNGTGFNQRVLQVIINGTATSYPLTASTSWTQNSSPDINIPAGASVKIGIYLNATGGAWSQFDDFEFVKK